MSQSVVDSLVQFLLKKNPQIQRGGHALIVKGKILNARTVPTQLKEIFAEELDENPLLLADIIDRQKDIVLSAMDAVKLEKDTPPDPSEVFLTNDKRFPLDESLVLVQPSWFKHFILYNQSTGDSEKIHTNYFRTKNFHKNTAIPYKDVGEVYTPILPSKYHELTDEERTRYPEIRCGVAWNHYTPPEYMLLPKSAPKGPPKILGKFLRHLFPDPAALKHVLQWMTALVSDYDATLPILVLCGKAAIGKNTLVESIMVGLVGLSNYHKAAQLSERFNSSIANCILHFSDEGEVDGIVKRNLKGFHELYVAIERKGVDVNDPERIYARFVVATNNRRDLNLDYNDRKFSVPELTEKKLTDEFSQEECDWLFGFKSNRVAQRRTRDWLVENYTTTRQAYHGPLFRQICYESLPNWFRTFVKMAEKSKEFGFQEYRKKSDNKRIALETVLTQLENYEHQLGRKIVRIEEDEFSVNFISEIYKGGNDER